MIKSPKLQRLITNFTNFYRQYLNYRHIKVYVTWNILHKQNKNTWHVILY